MTEINIEGVIFQIKQLFGVYCAFDSTDNVVGRADTLPVAVKICEQIAWQRRLDGKVDETPIDNKVVDEKQTLIDPVFMECNLCEHCKRELTLNETGATLKSKCALDIQNDGRRHCESYRFKEWN